jgi:solute:Na+ symporter, SSS family
MLTIFDFIVIGFYFVFVMSLGFVFKRFNKGSKDYFAGGQRMCWWLLGGSLFISNFSCWTFTGAAGIAYKYGILIMYVYLMDIIGYIIGWAFFATRLRQMRLITAIDGVRRRFGKINEQFFNWLSILRAPLGGGVWLLGLSIILTTVFVDHSDLDSKPTEVKISAMLTLLEARKPWEIEAAKKSGDDKEGKLVLAIRQDFEKTKTLGQKQWASLLRVMVTYKKYIPEQLELNARKFGYSTDMREAVAKQKSMSTNKNWIIVITGFTVLIMAMLGGNWAVAASDFIQLLLLMTITVVTAIVALVKVGGVTSFFNQLPDDSFQIFYALGEIKYDWLFLISMVLGSILLRNNMMTAGKYIAARDTRHARLSTLIPLVGYAVLPVLWFIPVWASYTLVPSLMTDYKGVVGNPEEMSYIATAMAILPQGLLGLLVVGLFAATMSSMDTSFNKNAGFIVCNFYRDILRPNAPDKELFLAGQIATAVSGGCVILVALLLANWGKISIFDSYLYFGAFFGSGSAVAFLLGMFVKKTPPWVAWSTALLSIILSTLLFYILRADWMAELLRPEIAGTFLSPVYEYIITNPFFMTNMIITPLCIGYFFLSRKFYKPNHYPKYVESVDSLFKDMKTPVDFDKEIGAENDNSNQQAKTLGILAVVYGTFILSLVFIPNPMSGRLAILGCASIMIGVGAFLWYKGQDEDKGSVSETAE